MISEKCIEFETFGNGKVKICRPGEEKAYITLNFGEKAVGSTRYYNALNADIHIKRVIRVPQRREIEANFLAEIDGESYVIKEAQHINKAFPSITVLALAEV